MYVIDCENRKRSCEDCDLSDQHINEIIQVLKDGGLVVYPTDTLYALGTDPRNEKALKQLFEVKGRPANVPVSIAVSSVKTAIEFADIDKELLSVMNRFLPGPLTVIAGLRKASPLEGLAMNGKIGIRIPNHPLVLRLTERFGPITTTSANSHGGREPIDASIAQSELGEKADIYVDCGTCKTGKPSTVIEFSDRGIQVLREGAIPREALHG